MDNGTSAQVLANRSHAALKLGHYSLARYAVLGHGACVYVYLLKGSPHHTYSDLLTATVVPQTLTRSSLPRQDAERVITVGPAAWHKGHYRLAKVSAGSPLGCDAHSTSWGTTLAPLLWQRSSRSGWDLRDRSAMRRRTTRRRSAATARLTHGRWSRRTRTSASR